MNILKDYSEYILEIKYFIIWYIDLYRKVEQEVNVDTFVQAINDLDKVNIVPYNVYMKYFVKLQNTDFIEVSKEVFSEINYWQKNKKCHEIYNIKKHRDIYSQIEIGEIADKLDIEECVMQQIEKEELKKKLKKKLNAKQYDIVLSLIFNDKKQAEIAKEKGVSRQAINKNLVAIRKKLNKFN